MDTSRILVIPDLHVPYQHKDAFDFLEKTKEILKPTLVICLGDELDWHAMSFHDSDADLFSAGHELQKSQAQISYLYELFPEMKLLTSNHGSMAYRRMKHHGMPRHLLKSYREVLQVGDGWTWHDKIILDMPNGSKCMFVHSLGADILRVSQSMGMSVVCGHHHSQFEIRYWQNDTHLNFAITSGCLIDDNSYAFAYNKLQPKRPIMGVTFIDNGLPSLIPMLVDNENNWIGTRIKK